MIAPAITKPLAAAVQRDYVSWSAISTYQQCPLRYYFRYIEGLEETFTSASLALGGGCPQRGRVSFQRADGRQSPAGP
ncbi:MAG: PD-(D/E)XK nuclease family protein [Pirellulales bacterium]